MSNLLRKNQEMQELKHSNSSTNLTMFYILNILWYIYGNNILSYTSNHKNKNRKTNTPHVHGSCISISEELQDS